MGEANNRKKRRKKDTGNTNAMLKVQERIGSSRDKPG